MTHAKRPHPGDKIDITATDWRPGPTAIRHAVKSALDLVARHNDGLVYIGLVRPFLPSWASGPQVGATICALVRQGVLVPTGEFAESGDARNRNATRATRVYRLVGDLTTDAKAAA